MKIPTSNSKYFKLSNDDFSKIIKLTDVKYYLHNSKLELPSDTICYDAKKKILKGLSDSEINTLKKEIHKVHIYLEFRLVNRINTLKDSNSIYWEPETVNEIFTQPDGVKFQSAGLWEYKESLSKLLELNLNDTAKNILENIINKLQKGMDNHDLSEIFEAHKLLHDFDYCIVNFPIKNFKAPPADWEGIYCYFGLIEAFNL